MAPRTRFTVIVGAALLAGSVLLALAVPSTASTTVTLPTAVEAWYQSGGVASAPTPAPVPTTPVAPPPANPYGAGTLHVGIRAGVEDARTYLRFDSGAVPFDGTITGGRLVLPVNPGAGTQAPEQAQIDVCLAPDPGPEVEGALGSPPAADCTTSTRAVYEAGTPARFVADLSELGVDSVTGSGFAVMPAGVARTTNATWHVSFLSRKAATDAAMAPRAEVEVDLPEAVAPATTSAPRSATPVVTEEFEEFEVFVDERPVFEDSVAARLVPPLPIGPAPSLGPRLALPTATSSPIVDDGRFRYSGVFVVPLLVAVVFWLLGSRLTSPPRLVRIDEIT